MPTASLVDIIENDLRKAGTIVEGFAKGVARGIFHSLYTPCLLQRGIQTSFQNFDRAITNVRNRKRTTTIDYSVAFATQSIFAGILATTALQNDYGYEYLTLMTATNVLAYAHIYTRVRGKHPL